MGWDGDMMKKKEETKDLKSYVKEKHVISPTDKTCQFKGMGDERFASQYMEISKIPRDIG